MAVNGSTIKSIGEELKERIIGDQIVQFNPGTCDTQLKAYVFFSQKHMS